MRTKITVSVDLNINVEYLMTDGALTIVSATFPETHYALSALPSDVQRAIVMQAVNEIRAYEHDMERSKDLPFEEIPDRGVTPL